MNIVPCMNNHIEKIGRDLLAIGTPLEMEVKHHQSPGVYIREINMPAGTVLVGKVHKTQYLNIVMSGLITIITPYRKFTVAGPCTFESFAGEQKIGIVHEDCIWSTVHATDETDIDKIVDELIASTVEQVDMLKAIDGIEVKI